MMRRENGRVVIDLDEENYMRLLAALGYAAGAANREGEGVLFRGFLRLANVVNEGNPNFTPYEVPDEADAPKAS